MKPTFRLAALAAGFMLTTATPLSAQAQPRTEPARETSKGNLVDLRPKFKEGQTVRFKMVMKSGAEGEAGQTMEQEIGVKLTTTKTNVETGSTVEMQYESLRVKIRAGELEVDFDSTKPSKDNPYDAVLRPLVGLKQVLVFDADGNITSVTSDGSGGGLSSLVAGQFSAADVAKGIFGPITGVRKGDGRVAVGDSWTNEDVIAGGMGTSKIATTNTLESYRGGKANISIKGSMLLDGSGSGGLPLVNIKDSTLRGKAVWDVEAGMLESMQHDQTLMVETPNLGLDGDQSPGKKSDKPSLVKHSMSVTVTRIK